jgi:ABC-2 type transport system permease protein
VWYAVWAIAYKEFITVFRSGALRKHFTLQALEFMMLAFININVRDLPTVIVDRDHTIESRVLAERLEATQVFRITYATSNTEQARAQIRSGRAKVALVIPPDYGKLRVAGATAKVLVLVDGADAASSSQAITALDGLTARMNLELELDATDDREKVTAHSILLFNPSGRTSIFMLPGMLAVTLAFGYVKMIMRGIVAERSGGTLDRLLMTPLNSTGLMLGKIVTYFAIGMVNAILFLLVLRYAFDLPIRGSVALLLLGTTLYVLSLLSLGALVASGIKNMGEANATSALLLVPSVTLSGFIYPLSSVPKALLPFAYALPQTHFIELVRGICLRGANGSDLLPAFGYLAVTPIVFGVLAARRFSKAVEAS